LQSSHGMTANAALTTTAQWDDVWNAAAGLVPRIQTGVFKHHARLLRLFERWLAPGKRFIEIGVGGSAWPAYLAQHFGVEAWGIDNSRPGLELARRAAAEVGQGIHLVEGDFFDASLLPRESFDVVYSGGFVEHFQNSREVMQRLADLVAPGGVVITTVPNLRGLNGGVQGLVDADCLACHVLYDPKSLDRAHGEVGLAAIESARFAGILDLGSVDATKLLAPLPTVARRAYWLVVSRLRKAGETVGTLVGRGDGGRWLSPAIVGVYARQSVSAPENHV
jgi:SAM-dependent methyltransferase